MANAAPSAASPRSLVGWLDVAAWLTFTAAWLYTAGWSFASHYFAHFHLGLLALEIPKEDYFLYSFWVLQDHWGWVAVVYLVGIGYVIGRRCLAESVWRRWEVIVVNVVAPVLGIILLWSSYTLGAASAKTRFTEQQRQDYPQYSRVQVWLTEADKTSENPPGKPQHRPPLPDQLAEGCYRLLLPHRDKVFVFKPLPEAPSADLSLLTIPLAHIRTLRVLPNKTSCGG